MASDMQMRTDNHYDLFYEEEDNRIYLICR